MKHLFTLLIAGCVLHTSFSQQKRTISVKEFMDVIIDHPDIKSNEQKITAFNADVELSKLSPDPSLTFGNVSGDVSGIDMPHQFYIGIDYTIETGGKRKHRIAYAKANRELCKAEHEVFVNEFIREALLTYQTCWLLNQRIKEINNYDSMLNWKNETDSMITFEILKIENSLRREEVEGEYRKALSLLQEFVSHQLSEEIILPNQPVWEEHTVADPIIGEKQPMLRLAIAEQRLRQEELLLEEAGRIGDISFTVGNNFITKGTNPEAPSPYYNAITATISMPLRISGLKDIAKVRKSASAADVAKAEAASLEEIKSQLFASQKENERLIQQLRKIQTLISLETKYIETSTNVINLINGFQKLQTLQDLRWNKLQQLSVNQSKFGYNHFKDQRKQLASFPSSN